MKNCIKSYAGRTHVQLLITDAEPVLFGIQHQIAQCDLRQIIYFPASS